jgi:uncharacterized protein (DUF488 family)
MFLTVFTIGHSTRTTADFIAALKAAEIEALADVRRFPFSRRHPHFNGEALAASLAAAGIAYRHFVDLGGRRAPRRAGLSRQTLWREPAFRAYADYAESAEFAAALARLKELAAERKTVIMCAEALWWQCHRRIITDYLLAAGLAVTHIFDAGKSEAARLTAGAAVRPDGSLDYTGEQTELPV